jgi:hypothetical protein
VEKLDPKRFKELQKLAQHHAEERLVIYQHVARLTLPSEKKPGPEPAAKGGA